MQEQVVKIYIADDHSIIIDGLKSILKQVPNFEIIGSSTDPKQVLQDIIKLAPDIVLIDEYMQSKNGSEILNELNTTRMHTKFVFLSSSNDQNIMLLVKKLGAHAFIHKNVGAKKIIEVLQDVHLGKERFDDLHPDFDPEANTIRMQKVLTPRELLLLNLILLGLTNKEIAERLDRSKHTIDTQRKSLYKKIKHEGYTSFSHMQTEIDWSKFDL